MVVPCHGEATAIPTFEIPQFAAYFSHQMDEINIHKAAFRNQND